MSANQSCDEWSEGQLRRAGSGGGRSGGSAHHHRGYSGLGTAASTPQVSSASVASQPLLTNQSFKKSSNVHGGQSRLSYSPFPESGGAPASHVVAQNGVHAQAALHGSCDALATNDAKVAESFVRRNSRAVPRAPSSQTTGPSDAPAPITPAKGDASKQFSLQYRTISPGIVKGMQIPARTSSAPPNLDEQKRHQARHDSFRVVPMLPIPSASKPQPQQTRKDTSGVNQSNSGEPHPPTQIARDVHSLISAVPGSAVPKSSTLPVVGMSMPVPFQQPQMTLQFGGPIPQVHSQGVAASLLQMPMTLPVGNACQVPQPMFLPHPSLQPQAMMHQNYDLGFPPQMGHQLPPLLGNRGIAIAPQFPLKQPGKLSGQQRKLTSMKITHPETHKELRLDKRTDVSHSQTAFTPVPALASSASQKLEDKVSELSISAPSGLKEKSSLETTRAKTTTGKRRKRRNIPSKADAAGTSDLFNAYKTTEEEHEIANASETTDSSTQLDEKPVPADTADKFAVATEEDGRGKTEVDDWGDAADISTPKSKTSEYGQHIHGPKKHHDNDNEALSRKKYSRDFLLTFSEQCRSLPFGFEIGSNTADFFMSVPVGTAYVIDREPYPSSGQVIYWSPGASRVDRRTAGAMDDDRWVKMHGSFGPGRDLRVDVGHGAAVVGSRPAQGVNHGVRRNLRGQSSSGGILSGPMQPLPSQGAVPRHGADADRWQPCTSLTDLLMQTGAVLSGPNRHSSASDRTLYNSERFVGASYDQQSPQGRNTTSWNRSVKIVDHTSERSSNTLTVGQAQGSVSGSQTATSGARPLSEEVLREKSMSTIREFYSAKDEDEVVLCVRELNAPSFFPAMVSLWVRDSFERKDMERDLLTGLLVTLSKSRDNLLSQVQLIQGFESVLSSLEDAVIDAPRAAEFLGRIFSKIILENVVPFSEIGRLIHEGGEEPGRLLDIGLAADVLGSILKFIQAEKGDLVLKEIQTRSNLRLEDFRPPNPIKSKKLDAYIPYRFSGEQCNKRSPGYCTIDHILDRSATNRVQNTIAAGLIQGPFGRSQRAYSEAKFFSNGELQEKSSPMRRVSFREGSSVINISSSSSDSDEEDHELDYRRCLDMEGNWDEKRDVEKDCFILDSDSYQNLTVDASNLFLSNHQDEDILVIAERGQVACRDYPHSRHLCVKYPFNKTDHQNYCSQCYCYVCDAVAPCEYWLGTVGHCHASDEEMKWNELRKSRRTI